MDDQEFCEAVARSADDPDAAYAACMRNVPRRGQLHQEACPASCAYCGTRFGTACSTKCSSCGAPVPASAVVGTVTEGCDKLYSDFLENIRTFAFDTSGLTSLDLSQYSRSHRKAIQEGFQDSVRLLLDHLEQPDVRSFNLRHCGID